MNEFSLAPSAGLGNNETCKRIPERHHISGLELLEVKVLGKTMPLGKILEPDSDRDQLGPGLGAATHRLFRS